MKHVKTTEHYEIPFAEFVRKLGLPWPAEGEELSYRVSENIESLDPGGKVVAGYCTPVRVTVQRAA